jgi:alpha-tubulin suppressor-like RCC1 family protein
MLASSRTLRTWTLLLAALLLASSPAHAAAAAGGEDHSAVVLPDGTVWVWGANDRGQLGDGTGVSALTPLQVPGLAGVVAVASGDDHVLALTGLGEVWAWGANESGQLGDGTSTDRLVPVAVLSGAVGIDAGPSYSLAWKADGSVWTWGANDSGQLGDGTLLPSDVPAMITGVGGVVQASAGEGHVIALASDGSIWSWGGNAFGQLGDGTQLDQLSPVAVIAVPDATVVLAGAGASYAVRSDGSLWAWGANDSGQLGDGTTTSRLAAAAASVPAGVEAVRAGGGHVLARLADGTVWSWGRNDHGQVGDGTLADRPVPAPLALTDIAEIAAGSEHSLAVTTDGVVWSWGSNALGQLGDGTTEDRPEPVAISGPGFSWKVGRPVLDPPEGTYEAAQDVTATSVTSGATILYTTDGSAPDETGPSMPSGGTVSIDETTTLKAQAVKQDKTPSDVVTAEYTLQVPAVTFSPEGGTYTEPQTVTLACTETAEIRYTDDGADPDESSALYADPIEVTETTTLKARAYKSGWEPSEIASADYEIPTTVPVQWTDLVGVAAAGSTLVKSAGGATAWDAGAVSTKAIASGDGWVEAAVETTGSTQMFGLAHGQSGEGYADIDFALYVNGSSLYVYEGGVSQGSLGGVAAGDALRVVVEGGVVRYLKNGAELWVSGAAPTYPLLVDTSVKNPGGKVSDVTLSGVLTDVMLEAPGTPVVWTDLVGVAATGNTLEKTAATTAWDAGAVSTKAIASGDAWVEAVVEATSSIQMFGLAHGQSGEGYGDIDFALYVTGSSLYAYEDGVSQGSLGPVTQGDRLRVVVEGGLVRYERNGKALLVSGATPTYPLLVDTSIKNPGGRVSGVTVSGLLTDVVLDAPGVPVVWADLAGVAATGNTLEKTAATTAWDAGASSNKGIASGDGWVEAVVETTSSIQMFGLSEGNSGEGYGDIDFALYVSGSSLYAYERGVSQGSLGPVTQGDRLRVVVEGGVVRYERNGNVLLVSGAAPTYPLSVDTSIKNPGGRVSRVTISGLLIDVPPVVSGIPVVWTDLVAVEADGNTLEKAADGASAWDAGAVSTKAIAVGDGWVEAVVETTGSIQMFGLAHGQSGQGYGDIDFALYVTGSSLYVYEGGVSQASLGPVTQGDRLRVLVEGGVVRYLRNDQELWVSAAAPAYPLLVDTSIKNPGGLVSDVTISGMLSDVVLEAPGTPVEWMGLVGVEATGHTLEKEAEGVSAWDSGAVSTKAIASGDGWVEAVVEETGSIQMFGLAQGQSGEGYGDIDFALYVSGSSLYAYEGGVSRGSLGPVTQGDRLRVVVAGGVVTYVRNGKELLASAETPAYPLLVDTSIKSPGGRVSSVTISGDLVDVVLDPPGLPVTWTDLVGVAADTNSLEKTSGTSAWDAGAISTTALASGDGWVEAVVEETGSVQMFGLSLGSSDPGYADIDFALYVTGSSLYAYEGGVSRGSLGPVTQGDRLRVVVEGGVVTYVRNGKTLLASGGAPAYPLVVDTSIKNPGDRIARVTISGDVLETLQVEAPDLAPPGGLYTSPLTVTLTPVTPGSVLHYTTDGSDPTEASPLYSAPLTIDTLTDFRARAFKPGWEASPVVVAVYQFDYGTLAPPAIAPAPGTYETSVEVTLSGPAGASLHYTTDGSDPTTTSPLYGGPFTLTASATVRAASFHPDWTASLIAEAAYEVKVATPVFAPGAGSYSTPQDVTVTTSTPGATVTYTTDGSDPTESDPTLGPGQTVHVDQSLTLRARAWKTGATPSDVVAAEYTIGAQTGAIAAGSSHSLALTGSRELWAWGANWSGQLGVGTTDPSNIPVLLAGLSDVVNVTGGGEHTLAVRSDGTVWAWGANWSGQLGDGTTDDRLSPVPVAGLTDVVAVAAGYEHSLALKSDGSVWTWGGNAHGQVGDGTSDDRLTPIQVSGLTDAIAIAAGSSHSLALTSDGTAWAWGGNWSGQLGDGTYSEQWTPVPISGLSDVVALAGGGEHSLAATSDGSVWSWGANWSGQLGEEPNGERTTPGLVSGLADIVALAAGAEFSLAVQSDGRVWSWGANWAGQLGDGTTQNRFTPAVVPGLADIVAVAAGSSHSLALRQGGQVFSWGDNYEGQLGVGDDGTEVPLPGAISGAGFQWSTVAPALSPPGGTFSSDVGVTVFCADTTATIHYTTDGSEPTEASAVIASGTILTLSETTTLKAGAWRPDRAPSTITTGIYAFAAATPTAYPPPGTYAGRVHVSLVTSPPSAEIRYTTDSTEPTPASPLYQGMLTFTADTTLKARAFPTSGMLDPSPVASFAYTLTPPVGAVAAGTAFSLALDPSGAVWAWGSNASGQLGDGTTADSVDPLPVAGIADAAEVAAGGSHALALLGDGSVWSWGDNTHGQIGTGAQGGTQLGPVQVAGLSDAVAIAAGGSHSLALTRDGAVWSWGSNASGQLGDGTTNDRATPAVVPGLAGVVAVAAGDSHSLALTVDGRVWAWGGNAYGQIGNDSYDPQQLLPVEVMSDAVSIAAGGGHSLAIQSDTSAWAWGRNDEGQLGSEDWDDSPVPVRTVTADPCGGEGGGEGCGAQPFTDVKLLAGGGQHTLAVTVDRLLWSWGANDVGQLGNGGSYTRNPADPLYGLSDVVRTAGGQDHSLAVTAAGEVWAWGGNASGQVGDGTTQNQWNPVLVVPAGFAWRLPRPTMSPPPGYYTAAVDVTIATPVAGAVVRYTTDGTEPTEASTLVTGPIPIAGSIELKARTFKAGWAPSATAGGWYSFYFGTLDPPVATPAGGTYVTSVEVTLTAAPGATISFELCDPGWINCTGWEDYLSPVQIDRSRILRANASHPDWSTSSTITETYTVQAAQPVLEPVGGTYPPGQLITVTCPDPATTLHYTTSGVDPTESDRPLACGGSIPAADFTLKVRAFKPGLSPSAVVSADYSLTEDLTQATLVAGRFHSLALRADGLLWAWGSNSSGQIGEAGAGAGLGPTRVSALAAVTAVAAGGAHTLATTNDGYLWAWGANGSGQLGDGTATARPEPVPVPGLTDVVALAAGSSHSLALRSDGTVWAWGRNSFGQLGDGTGTDQLSPVQVPALTDVVAIAAGDYHSLAIRSDGSVWAWGWNSGGQLGDGGTEDRYAPVPVDVLTSNAVAISAGADHSLALTADGRVYAWGENYVGQLGLGDEDARFAPVEVPGLAGITRIGAGAGHSLALTAGGSIWAWGYNLDGQLGDGSTTSRTTPGVVPGLPAVAGIGTDGYHVLAMAADGRVWGWGSNGQRQVGDWTTESRPTPTQVAEAGFEWMASMPTFSVASGTHTAELSVDILTATPNADVRYTLDGTDPTETSPIVAGAIAVDQSLTLKARAFRADLAPSSVGAADYVLQVPTPVLSPSGGTHHHFVEVMVTSAVGSVTLHYTLDGNEPTQSDPVVVPGGTVYVGESGRLSVKGWRPGWDPSAVAAADYVITAPRPLDTDGDGLSDADEAALGSDPNNPDTNGDGLPDGAAYAAGLSLTETDMDADGLANLDEAAAGTDPFDPDSDGDSAPDGADCYPLDPARSACLPPDPSDVTAPDITLAEPTNAVLVGTTP